MLGRCHVCNSQARAQRGRKPYYLAAIDLPLQRHRLTVPYRAKLQLFERTARYVEGRLCYACYELLEAFSGEPCETPQPKQLLPQSQWPMSSVIYIKGTTWYLLPR